MTAMTVSELITRVKRQFGDESGVQIDDDDIVRWINDAQREIYMQHEELANKTQAISSVAGTHTYDIPSDLLTLQSVAYRESSTDDRSYYPLRFLGPKAATDYLDGYDTTSFTASPQYFSRGDEKKFRVYPTPDVSYTGGFKLTYSRYPTPVADSSGVLDVPEYYALTVLEYCLMKAYEMDEDWEVADKKANYVQSTINFNQDREAWFGRETYPTIVVSPDDL